jgi:predicted lipoprotein with Yx(FWY)xxD motif
MKRAIAVVAGAGAVAAFAAGCSNATSPTSVPPALGVRAPSGSAAPATSAIPTPTGPADVMVASTPLGTILTDKAGRTLYLFKADTGKTSTCYGACAAAWPPYLTDGTPTGSGNGLTSSKFGTTTRTDHTTQVTYNGHPLYYFAEDTMPKEIKGQGVNAFGALWYVVDPAGNAVTATPSANPSSSGGGITY